MPLRSSQNAVTRRRFLKGTAIAGGALALSGWRGAAAQEPAPDHPLFVPLVSANADPSRVVHIHDQAATHWDFATGWYGSAVSQAAVNEIVNRGVMELTGRPSVAPAWAALMPDYHAGQRIAVKVNLNNASCDDADNAIDALIEVVNAVVSSLVAAGIDEADVWVYDALWPMPARFYGRRQHTRAHFCDSTGCADEWATLSCVDESLVVHFDTPGMATRRWLTDILYYASYVINMPILKIHGWAPVTLGFKNHFGSLNNLGGDDVDNPHAHINPAVSSYSPDYSPLVDIYCNPNIAAKTVLTVGDGLFGAPAVGSAPRPWHLFGDRAPNSLLFGRDPVAIDCVMCDMLRSEWGLPEAAYDYLRLAKDRGLGIFERGDPFGSGYTRFEYVRVEL